MTLNNKDVADLLFIAYKKDLYSLFNSLTVKGEGNSIYHVVFHSNSKQAQFKKTYLQKILTPPSITPIQFVSLNRKLNICPINEIISLLKAASLIHPSIDSEINVNLITECIKKMRKNKIRITEKNMTNCLLSGAKPIRYVEKYEVTDYLICAAVTEFVFALFKGVKFDIKQDLQTIIHKASQIHSVINSRFINSI